MRVLANFSKKVSTGNYENETFTVTVEAETEFNHLDQVSDYLFAQARAAVDRQVRGEYTAKLPDTTIPIEVNDCPESNSAGGDDAFSAPSSSFADQVPTKNSGRNGSSDSRGQQYGTDQSRNKNPGPVNETGRNENAGGHERRNSAKHRDNGSNSRFTENTGDNGGIPLTEKQKNLLYRLLRDNFDDREQAKSWLLDNFEESVVTHLTRKTASRVIDALLDRKRSVAA